MLDIKLLFSISIVATSKNSCKISCVLACVGKIDKNTARLYMTFFYKN